MNTFRVSNLRMTLVLLASTQLLACSAFNLESGGGDAWSYRWTPEQSPLADTSASVIGRASGQGFSIMENNFSMAPSAGLVREHLAQQTVSKVAAQAAPVRPMPALAEVQKVPEAGAEVVAMARREMPKRPAMEMAKVSLGLDTEQGACQTLKAGFASNLTNRLDELMALYMSQAEVLSGAEMVSRTKFQLMSDVSLKFLDVQTKARGVEYLKDTLYGLCRLHALGVMDQARYVKSVNALMDGTAKKLTLDVHKLRLDLDGPKENGLIGVSKR